jgi:hypothetical protein
MFAFALALLVAAISAAGPAPAADSVVAFSRLGPGEVLRVHFKSSGCFHNDAYDLVFWKGPRLTVRVSGVEYGVIRSLARDRFPRSLGTLALSDSEAAGLDSLLGFYRSRPGGGCTTADRVEVVYLRDGATAASETFVDGSCAIQARKGVVSFRQLIGRAQYGPGPGR